MICFAATLADKSVAPAWTSASQAEKDAWIKSHKFKNAKTDQRKVAACLDDYVRRPLFATNDLAGVASLCEMVIEGDENAFSP